MVRSGALVCRKIKLKKFPDPETAGGCGVVPFPSAKGLFCLHVATSERRCEFDLIAVSPVVALVLSRLLRAFCAVWWWVQKNPHNAG